MAHKKKAHSKKMSSEHKKEYENMSASKLKKHMGQEKGLLKEKMAKGSLRGC